MWSVVWPAAALEIFCVDSSTLHNELIRAQHDVRRNFANFGAIRKLLVHDLIHRSKIHSIFHYPSSLVDFCRAREVVSFVRNEGSVTAYRRRINGF